MEHLEEKHDRVTAALPGPLVSLGRLEPKASALPRTPNEKKGGEKASKSRKALTRCVGIRTHRGPRDVLSVELNPTCVP